MSRCQWCAKPLVDDMEVVDRECSDCWVKHALRDEMETPMDERAQEQGGAVQSAEEFYQRLDECWGFADQTEDEVAISQVLAIKQRDAAIRRAAIEECDAQISQLKELLLDRQSSPEYGDAYVNCVRCRGLLEYTGTEHPSLGHERSCPVPAVLDALAASGPPSERGAG